MPPKFALILYTGFVLFLLWTDRKKGGKMSPALWLPMIWLMYSGSRAVSYWLYPETFMAGEGIEAADGNPVDRIFLTALIGSGIWVLQKRRINWQELKGQNGWIFMLFIYLGISVLWSDFLSVSFKRYIRAIGDVIMVLILVTEPDTLAAVRRIILRCSFILIPMSVLLVKYYHDLGISYNDVTGTTMWIGVTTHKNQLGQLSCVCALTTLWCLMGTWRQRDIMFYNTAAVFYMALWLLEGPAVCTSKTSIVVFIFASAILIISNLFKRRPKSFGRFVLAGGLVFLFLQTMSEFIFNESLVDVIVASSGGDITFTGRTYLWEELLKIGAQHPVLGVGFGGFWIGDQHALWEKFQWMPESAHNGYLDVYLDVGMVGLLLLLGVILATYKSIVKVLPIDFEYGRMRLIFLVITLIYNWTESSFSRPTNFIWFVFLIFALWSRDASDGQKSPLQASSRLHERSLIAEPV